MSKEDVIDFLDESEVFEEGWEMANEGSEWMHPNEDDDEFFEHEAPDKD
jgi:hypothetical protein